MANGDVPNLCLSVLARERLESTSLVRTPVTDSALQDFHQHRLNLGTDPFNLKYHLYSIVVSIILFSKTLLHISVNYQCLLSSWSCLGTNETTPHCVGYAGGCFVLRGDTVVALMVITWGNEVLSDMAVQRIYFLQAQEHLVGISSVNDCCDGGVGGGSIGEGEEGNMVLNQCWVLLKHMQLWDIYLNCCLPAQH